MRAGIVEPAEASAALRRAARLVQAGLHILAENFLAERERWVLWLPVGFGAGIGGYFGLTIEPRRWLGALVLACALAVWFGAGRWMRGREETPRARWLAAAAGAALVLAVIAAGFAAAQWQEARVAAPVLTHRLGPVALSGEIAEVDGGDSPRVLIGHPRIERLRPEETPLFVRVRLAAGPALAAREALRSGRHIRLKAILLPPPGPSLPGGFDFQRFAYFERLGAVGFALGAPESDEPAGTAAQPTAPPLRDRIVARIRAVLPGVEGSLAVAIIAGERGGIPEAVDADFRDSGLVHLLVIAGLHMSLVSGFVFFAVRAILALIPAVALRWPIKKWAALAAFAAATGYLVISGAAVPTQRAFIMCGLGLAAIALDRFSLSMRAVAAAALIVLALDPVALTGVSFQMSFAAALSLVAFYESWQRRIRHADGEGWLGGLLRHFGGILATTLVATIGTAAFSIHHFNRFAVYSALANMLAVPIASLWVIPWAVIAMALMPLGLESWALHAMGWGLSAVIAVAHWVAGLPMAVVASPSLPPLGLIAIASGGLWLALWRRRWRYAGLLLILGGAASLLWRDPPDLLVAPDARLVAVRLADGSYRLSSLSADKRTAHDWAQHLGIDLGAGFPPPGSAGTDALRCDPAGCLFRRDGWRVALDWRAEAVAEDCAGADLLVALVPSYRRCRSGAVVVDRTDLKRNGAYAIWLRDGIRTLDAGGERGARPWVPAAPVYARAEKKPPKTTLLPAPLPATDDDVSSGDTDPRDDPEP